MKFDGLLEELFDKYFQICIEEFVRYNKSYIDLYDFSYDLSEVFVKYFKNRIEEEKILMNVELKIDHDKYKEFLVIEEVK